jgi:RNA polymerase sigma-70 factor (ECF subfamily)
MIEEIEGIEGIEEIEGIDATIFQAVSLREVADDTLVQRIADGDKTALKVLYLRHRTRIYRFVARLTGSDTTADEVVNEVFLEVWRHADQFEGKSRLATWLLSIARFKAISACRRRAEAPLDERACALIEDPADDPASSMEKRQRSDILQRCMGTLRPSHQAVINLIYYQGKKIEEVAQNAGVPAATIKTRLHYARSRMAERLAEAGVDRAWVQI